MMEMVGKMELSEGQMGIFVEKIMENMSILQDEHAKSWKYGHLM